MPEFVNYIPVATTVLSLVFGTVVLRRYIQRVRAGSTRSTHLLWWAIGVFIFGAGTFTEAYHNLVGWNEPIFRGWYILGALLGGAPLAQGTVYLLFRKKTADLMAVLATVYVIVATVCVMLSPVDAGMAEELGLTGKVLEWEWVRLFTPFINTYALIFLVGGAVYSAYRFWQSGVDGDRVLGNVLIAVGALLPGIGGGFTRAGYVEVLYVCEFIGLSFIFFGYHLNVKARPAAQATGAKPRVKNAFPVSWTLGALGIALLVGTIVGISVGPADLDIGRLASGFFRTGDQVAQTVVWDLRLARVFTALVVGACLGTAGFLLQGSTRNPLGDPQIFGVGGGAAIVTALAMGGLLRIGLHGTAAVSVAASLVGAAVIAFFASRRGISPARLALIGVSVAALSGAVATGILAGTRVFTQQSVAFLGGSLANRTWDDTASVVPYLAIGLALALPAVRGLNVLSLGDSIAANLGGDPRRTRIMATASAGVLGGAAVALAGVVGFVGLLIPHVARLLVGRDARAVFLVCIPLGAVLTLFADQVARLIFMPSEVPVGLLTALLGAPLMIFVARRVE